MDLSRKLARLEALAQPADTLRVWLPDPDDDDTVVCASTGDRLPLGSALRLGSGQIVVRYVDDWRGYDPGP
jgi:hypothetical protein